MIENPTKSIVFHGCFDGNHPKSSEDISDIYEKMPSGEFRDGCIESMATVWAHQTCIPGVLCSNPT